MAESSAVSNGMAGGGAMPAGLAAWTITSSRRRRQIVGDVEEAGRLGMRNAGQHGPGDVVDMDAIEHLPRLDDAPRLARAQTPRWRCDPGRRCRRGGRPGPALAARLPSRAKPAPPRRASGRARCTGRRRRLVDPGALMIAIDADGREVADPAQTRRAPDVAAHAIAARGSPSASGRGRDEKMRCAGERRARASGSACPRTRWQHRSRATPMQPLPPRCATSRSCASLGAETLRQRARPSNQGRHRQMASCLLHASDHSASTRASALRQSALRARGRDRASARSRPTPRPPWRAPGARHRPAAASTCGSSVASPRVAGGDQHVAQEAVAARALDRRAGEPRAKGCVVQREQLGQRRIVVSSAAPRSAGRAQPRRTCSTGQTARQSSQPKMRLPIARAELARDVPLVLDGQVGDAAARIELVGRREGIRRADVEAAPAAAAVIALGVVRLAARRSSGWRRAEQPGADARARRDWCACPASRARRPRPAAFPSVARCRRTP